MTRRFYAVEYARGFAAVITRDDRLYKFFDLAARDAFVMAGPPPGPGYRSALPASHPAVRRAVRAIWQRS